MQCYLSTSCYPNTFILDAISRCEKLNSHYIEISAPHSYQPLNEYEIILKEKKNEGFNIVLHNYFPPPKSPFILNIATNDQKVLFLFLLSNVGQLPGYCRFGILAKLT